MAIVDSETLRISFPIMQNRTWLEKFAMSILLGLSILMLSIGSITPNPTFTFQNMGLAGFALGHAATAHNTLIKIADGML